MLAGTSVNLDTRVVLAPQTVITRPRTTTGQSSPLAFRTSVTISSIISVSL
jgi:hypothetical protein